MKTVYVPKSALSSYVVFPVPSNLGDYYAVQVDDSWIGLGMVYNPTLGQFTRQVASSEEIDALRRAAYSTDVDPLISESTIKRAIGDTAGADALLAQAIAAREAIQNRYPKTTA